MNYYVVLAITVLLLWVLSYAMFSLGHSLGRLESTLDSLDRDMKKHVEEKKHNQHNQEGDNERS